MKWIVEVLEQPWQDYLGIINLTIEEVLAPESSQEISKQKNLQSQSNMGVLKFMEEEIPDLQFAKLMERDEEETDEEIHYVYGFHIDYIQYFIVTVHEEKATGNLTLISLETIEYTFNEDGEAVKVTTFKEFDPLI